MTLQKRTDVRNVKPEMIIQTIILNFAHGSVVLYTVTLFIVYICVRVCTPLQACFCNQHCVFYVLFYACCTSRSQEALMFTVIFSVMSAACCIAVIDGRVKQCMMSDLLRAFVGCASSLPFFPFASSTDLQDNREHSTNASLDATMTRYC